MSDLPAVLEPVLPAAGLNIRILGLGGVGEKIARYGCLQWAALATPCRVTLADGDAFEAANAARMFFSRPGNKATVLREDLLPFVAESQLTLVAVEAYLTAENAPRLVREGDVVFMAVDNHRSRKILTDHVKTLRSATVISAGNDGVEVRDGRSLRGTYATVQVWVRREGEDRTPDLARFHPEIADPRDRHPSEKSCAELLAGGGTQLVLTNLAVASAALNAFFLLLTGTLHYAEICLDIAEGRMHPTLPLSRRLGLA